MTTKPRFRAFSTVIGGLSLAVLPLAVASCSSDTAEKPQPCTGKVDQVIEAKSGYHFSPANLTATSGAWTVKLVNTDTLSHTFEVKGATGDIASVNTDKKKQACVTLTLVKGEYSFRCTVSGHEASGMKGTLTVS